ncbi:MAG: hypothetical protein B6I35_02580, partial [Anaerolineaceae bacterium 4572_32.2]
GMIAAVAVVVTAVLLLPLFVGAALFTRQRAGWEATAAIASGLALIAGYLLLDAAVRAALPASPNWAAVLRLGLLALYALLAAWLAPRLAGVPQRPLWAWLGLNRSDLPTVLLALAVAALATIPWPLTGALRTFRLRLCSARC